MKKYSVSPSKEKFQLPGSAESEREAERISRICAGARKKGQKIIAVQGLGFVGAINAAVIADTNVKGKTAFCVLGIDMASESSFWKISEINRGICPYKSEDPNVDVVFRNTVTRKKNFHATWLSKAYEEVDMILVDVNLDVIKTKLGDAKNSTVAMESFKTAITAFGEKMNPNALVLVETTVPPGTVENIIQPLLIKIFKKRGINVNEQPPLIAHSYERIMPGKDYVDSIRKIWRSYSGTSRKAELKAEAFLRTITDTANFPLWKLPRPNASEMGKVLENSYRAMNIAFMHEWTKFAEDIGVNLFEVVKSIKVRKGTHDNMMFPGFGVGGYCLTKDTLLAQWASKTVFRRNKHLNLSVQAIDINDQMPLHTADLVMKSFPKGIKKKKIAVLGASYRMDVDDTRNSPTELLYDVLVKKGGILRLHDPFAVEMTGRPEIRIHKKLETALANADAVVLTVNHSMYLNLSVKKLTAKIKKKAIIIDAFDILTDQKITQLKKLGHEVFGVGKGHINTL